MKPVYLFAAVCAALLCGPLAEAGVTSKTKVRVAQQPAVVAAQAVVGHQQSTRRLRLGERLRARFQAHRAIRKIRVQTVKAIVKPVTLGIECNGCER